jgi:hypothetical protein
VRPWLAASAVAAGVWLAGAVLLASMARAAGPLFRVLRGAAGLSLALAVLAFVMALGVSANAQLH